MPLSVGPAAVGSAYGATTYGATLSRGLDPVAFALVLAAFYILQIAANLHRQGDVSADLSPALGEAKADRTPISKGALGTKLTSMIRRRPYYLFYGASLALVLLIGLWVEVVEIALLGLLGIFLVYSYSASPLRLAHRKGGEISTFFAYGPIIVVVGALAQAPWLKETFAMDTPRLGSQLVNLLLLGSAFGFLATSVSIVHHFLTLAEDRERQDTTPAVRLGWNAAAAAIGTLAFCAGMSIANIPFYSIPFCPPWMPGPGSNPVVTLGATIAILGAIPGVVLAIGRAKWLRICLALTVMLHIWTSVRLLSMAANIGCAPWY